MVKLELRRIETESYTTLLSKKQSVNSTFCKFAVFSRQCESVTTPFKITNRHVLVLLLIAQPGTNYHVHLEQDTHEFRQLHFEIRITLTQEAFKHKVWQKT